MKLLRTMLLVTILLAFGTSQVSAHSTISIVDITDDGFEPREVDVDVNSVVRFTNKTKVDRWPASNPHPVHTIYPEFDPQKSISPGSSWDFKPTNVGTWKYHDHLFPHQRGTLIVIGEANEKNINETAQETTAENSQPIKTDTSFIHNLFATLTNLLHKLLTPEKVDEPVHFVNERTTKIDAFKQLGEQEQYQKLKTMSGDQGLEKTWIFIKTYPNEGHAHDLAHFFGALVYEQRGIKGLAVCDPTFAFGCFHGFTEAAFTKSIDQLATVARSCESVGKKGSGPWASCIHGIGHGVATYVDVADLNQALQICDRLESGQQFCWDGVFMEFTISAPKQFFGANPSTLCTTLEKKYHGACGRSLPRLLTSRLGGTLGAVAQSCLHESDLQLADSCIDAIGLQIGQESTGRPETVHQGCAKMPSLESYAHCITAGAGELVFQNYPGWEIATYRLCSALDKTSSESCFQRVRQLALDYSRL